MTPFAVALAGLLGAAHCAAMCGGFVALYAGGGVRGPWPHLAYNGGRLVAYVALGALAGALAAGLDATADALLGIQAVASAALGVVILLIAARELGVLRKLGLSRDPALLQIDDPRPRAPGRLLRLATAVARRARRGDPAGAGLLGLASALLPCGWLWGFVALAGATGGALSGALVMAAFWLGTVPALVAIGGLMGVAGGWLRRHARVLTAVGMISAALMAFGTRWEHGLRARLATDAAVDFACHGGPATPVSAPPEVPIP